MPNPNESYNSTIKSPEKKAKISTNEERAAEYLADQLSKIEKLVFRIN